MKPYYYKQPSNFYFEKYITGKEYEYVLQNYSFSMYFEELKDLSNIVWKVLMIFEFEDFIIEVSYIIDTYWRDEYVRDNIIYYMFRRI